MPHSTPTEGNDNGANETRCGYVAIVGRPNVGKSSLLNLLVGAKLSSTANRPQTTRHRINGILTRRNSQIVLVDTPGIHFDQQRLLNKALNRTVVATLADVDVVVLLVEHDRWGREEDYVLELVAEAGTPCVLCINKVDLLRDKSRLLPYIAVAQKKAGFLALIPISARSGENVPGLIELLENALPASPFYFSEDALTDRSERFVVSELIREQLVRQLEQEMPYALYVEIDDMAERQNDFAISATIWVEREGQKGIVIGKQGARLKAIGTQARKSITTFLGRPAHLKLWVKHRPGWQDNPRVLAGLGIEG